MVAKTTAVAVQDESTRAAALVAQVLTKGDVSGLNPDELTHYYKNRCDAMGLDARAQPFDIVTFQGKKVLYPNKSCAEQLRRLHGVTTRIVSQETTPEGLRVVTVEATDRHGRQDVDVAALVIKGLTGEALANAYMKVITKAKRRVTFSLCGLGGIPDIDEEEERKAGLRRLHVVGNERGLDHAQVREFAQQHYPAIASLTELDADDLTVVADALASDEPIDLETGEILDAEVIEAEIHPAIQQAIDNREANWLAAIEGAATMGELQRIGAQIAEAGVKEGPLRVAYANRRDRLQDKALA